MPDTQGFDLSIVLRTGKHTTGTQHHLLVDPDSFFRSWFNGLTLASLS